MSRTRQPHREPLQAINLAGISPEIPARRKKKLRSQRRQRKQPVVRTVSSSDEDDGSHQEENDYFRSERIKQKTPSPRNQQKQTKKERYQQRGSDTEAFSPTPSKRMELSTSVDDLSLLAPGVLARLAVCNNDIHGLKKMLQEDPTLLNDVAEVGESGAEEGGLTVLHVACMVGNAECTELIIRLHPNIDALSESGRTALHYACMQGQATCVNLLLSAGADYWLKDIMDSNAKDYAEDAAAGDWALCVAEINAKEVEFGFKMMKRGAGIVSMIAIIGGLCYWLTKKEK